MHTIFSFPNITTQRQAYRVERVRQAGGSPKCKCRIPANQVARLKVIGFEWEMHDVFAVRWEVRVILRVRVGARNAERVDAMTSSVDFVTLPPFKGFLPCCGRSPSSLG